MLAYRLAVETLYTTVLCIGTIQGICPKTLLGESLTHSEQDWSRALATNVDFASKDLKIVSNLSALLDFPMEYHDISEPTDRLECWTEMEMETEELWKADCQGLHAKSLLMLMVDQITPGTRCTADEAIAILRQTFIRNADGDASLKILCVALKAGMHGRRCVVLDGRYFGAVPAEAIMGDIVCFLIGCSVPVCLRQDLGRQTLIGECYVDGYMDGEALQERNKNTLA